MGLITHAGHTKPIDIFGVISQAWRCHAFIMDQSHCLCNHIFQISTGSAIAEPMAKEQGEARLHELKQMKRLLQRPQYLRQPASQTPKTDEPAGI